MGEAFNHRSLSGVSPHVKHLNIPPLRFVIFVEREEIHIFIDSGMVFNKLKIILETSQ